MRVAIDLRINVAKWYNVKVSGYAVAITERPVSAMNARCATSDRHVYWIIAALPFFFFFFFTCSLSLFQDLLISPDPVILAFDIETTKQPLKFPDMVLSLQTPYTSVTPRRTLTR